MTEAKEPEFVLNPALDSEGLHIRTRVRKASLSDGVSVERIGVLDRKEPFDEATRDLNKEIDERKSPVDTNHTHQE